MKSLLLVVEENQNRPAASEDSMSANITVSYKRNERTGEIFDLVVENKKDASDVYGLSEYGEFYSDFIHDNKHYSLMAISRYDNIINNPKVSVGHPIVLSAKIKDNKVVYMIYSSEEENLTNNPSIEIIETYVWEHEDNSSTSQTDTYTDHREVKRITRVLRHITETGEEITNLIPNNGKGDNSDNSLIGEIEVTWRTNDRTGEVSNLIVNPVIVNAISDQQFTTVTKDTKELAFNGDKETDSNVVPVGNSFTLTAEVKDNNSVVFKVNNQEIDNEVITETYTWKEVPAPPIVEDTYTDHREVN